MYTFPPPDQVTNLTIAHVIVVSFLSELIANVEFVTAFAQMLKQTDKRISGIHVTLLASVYNLCNFVHKVYVFKLVEYFGIFGP